MKRKTNKELANELNELVDELEKYTEMKFMPYLGWYLRDIDEDDATNLPLSRPEGEDFWWIDVPRKWDYPHYRCTERESRLILKKAIKLAHAWLDYVKTVNEIANGGAER